jgi:hypothetical protein
VFVEDSDGLRYGPVSLSFKYGNEPYRSREGGALLQRFNNYNLLFRNSMQSVSPTYIELNLNFINFLENSPWQIIAIRHKIKETANSTTLIGKSSTYNFYP